MLAVVSLILMTLDQHLDGFAKLRSSLSVVVVPIHYIVDSPIHWVHWLGSGLSRQEQLLKENAALRANELLLQAKIHELSETSKVSHQVQTLVHANVHGGSKFLVSELLAVDVDDFAEQLVIDKGKPQGVYVGQPVFDADGVFGQVINVGPMTSLVMLLTDMHSAIPVQVERTGTRAIAVGSGDGNYLTLLHVSDTTDIVKGDRLLTSGLGLRFPMGYPVGVVDVVEHVAGQGFAAIKVIPSAHLRQSRQVLLVWPTRASFLPQVQEQLQKSPLIRPANSNSDSDSDAEDNAE